MFGRRFLPAVALFGALFLAGPSTPAVACPMCKMANESKTDSAENLKPKAFMYSILFMLAMPATLLTGFGIGFYRLSKKNGAGESPSGESQSDVDP
jgi:hypothetical protein